MDASNKLSDVIESKEFEVRFLLHHCRLCTLILASQVLEYYVKLMQAQFIHFKTSYEILYNQNPHVQDLQLYIQSVTTSISLFSLHNHDSFLYMQSKEKLRLRPRGRLKRPSSSGLSWRNKINIGLLLK